MPECDEIEVEDVSLPAGTSSRIMVRIFRSAHAPQPAPVVLYLPDRQTGTGDAELPDHHLKAMADQTRAAVLAPRPERCSDRNDLELLYVILCWISYDGHRRWLDATRLAVVGEGSGARLCSQLAREARERGAPKLRAGSIPWPPESDPGGWREAAGLLMLRTALHG